MYHFSILCCYPLFILFGLKSCTKDIPKGTTISANGFVVDTVKNKRLPQAIVYLFGARSSFYRTTYSIGPLDSAVADDSGIFSIQYLAEGTSVDYAIVTSNPAYSFQPGGDRYELDPFWLYPFSGAHSMSNVKIKMREPNYLKLSIHVLSNPYDTLAIYINTTETGFSRSFSLYGNTIDTSLLTKYIPGMTHLIDYTVYCFQLSDSGMGFHRAVIDTVKSNMDDTIYINKTIQSAYDIPLSHF